MAARTWSARCLVVSLLLYCSLYELLPWAWLLVPFVTATVLRACTRQPLVLVLAAVLCHLLGPPQWLLWHADYNEPFYQEQAPSNWIAGLLLWGLGWGLGSALNWTARSRRTLGLVVALTSLLSFPGRALDLSPSLLPTLDTPPAPHPRSTTARSPSAATRASRSIAGRNRWSSNSRYCCGFQLTANPSAPAHGTSAARARTPPASRAAARRPASRGTPSPAGRPAGAPWR